MDLSQEYDLEIKKAVKIIKNKKYKNVCLQFPDGLKPLATKVAREIEEKTKARIFIWLGSCYGACDLPPSLNEAKIDLLIQFGHEAWNYKDKNLKVF